jgi:hypothetical protein
MIVPGPSIWAPGLIRKKLSFAAQKRFSKIASSLFLEGYISATQLRTAIALGNFGTPIVAD